MGLNVNPEVYPLKQDDNKGVFSLFKSLFFYQLQMHFINLCKSALRLKTLILFRTLRHYNSETL